MSASANHGASTRRPVVYGNRRIPNLTVRTLDDGTDVYEVRLRMPDGSQPRVKLEATTPTEAVRERNGLLVDRDRGVERENRLMNPTVTELLDEYLEEIRSRVGIKDGKRRLAPSTVDSRECAARLYIRPPLGRLRVADVTAADVRRLIARVQGKGLAPASTGIVLRTLSLALQFAVKNGYVDRNIARDLSNDDRPGDKRLTEPRYLTQGELELLLAAAPNAYRPIWACLAYAALRIGEALGLQWECIDLRAGTITIRQQAVKQNVDGVGMVIVPYTKNTTSAATLNLVPALARELVAHRSQMAEIDLRRVRPEAPVFATARGRIVHASTSLRVLKRTADEAGLNPPELPPLGHHDLRHTCAALAFQAGASPVEVAELMRHANPAVTMAVYAGLTKEGRGAAFRKLLDAGFGT